MMAMDHFTLTLRSGSLLMANVADEGCMHPRVLLRRIYQQMLPEWHEIVIFDLQWRSPESGDVCYKSRRLKQAISGLVWGETTSRDRSVRGSLGTSPMYS